MIITQINCELAGNPTSAVVRAVQEDANTRAVEATFLEHGEPWSVPAGANVSVAYKKADGTSGWYDKLPDKSSACVVRGNVVTATLAPQIFTAPGRVTAVIVFRNTAQDQISSFPFQVLVEPHPAAGKVNSDDYFDISAIGDINKQFESINSRLTALEKSGPGGSGLTPAQQSSIKSLPFRFTPDAHDDPRKNSQNLQALIDAAAGAGGGSIHIPAGVYSFGSTGTVHFPSGRISDYCVRMRSNVSIYGDGMATLLLPKGQTEGGLDMFYFNDYREKNQANYLENCRFSHFTVDCAGTSCRSYTTAGKVFMFDLIKNCRWYDITVLHSDGTGIGVDCPIDCSIEHCTAIGCGKAAPSNGHGASGVGIGFGYSNQECMLISDCTATDNANYGIFYEGQFRFKPELYPAKTNKGLFITNCRCSNNHHNFGSERGINVHMRDCYSEKAKEHGYLATNSVLCSVKGCISNSETGASFVIKTTVNDDNERDSACKDISISDCTSKNSTNGIKLYRAATATATMERIAIKNVEIWAPKSNAIDTFGDIKNLKITGNVSDVDVVSLNATGLGHYIKYNTWNK